MDGSFEFLLPKNSITQGFEFEIPMFEWQGVNYPQGTAECKFGSNFILKISENSDILISSYKKSMPKYYQNEEWHCIEVLGKGMEIYIGSLYELGAEEINNSLKDLINTLLQDKTMWAVVYSHQDDGFEEVKKGSISDILLNFENAIRKSEGFMIYA